jgi:hypothetical protein
MLPTEFVHLVKRLQRRKLKSEKLTVNRCQVMAKAHMAGELKRINKISTKYYTETKDRATAAPLNKLYRLSLLPNPIHKCIYE